MDINYYIKSSIYGSYSDIKGYVEMNKLDLFLEKECIVTPAMRTTFMELWKAYLPYQSLKKTKGPRTSTGLMSNLEKLGIHFSQGAVYGLGLRRVVPVTLKQENQKDTDMAYKKLDKEKYGEYLASRAWWVKRQAVMRRAEGKCERCKKNPASAVHHKTYARIYEELLTDLQAICKACHDYEHAKSNYDPLKVKDKK